MERSVDVSMVETDEEDISIEEKNPIYVPVAFVIQTEVEYHDIFREVLLDLFESIRAPKIGLNLDIENRRDISFADFIAHIAFLKTIPCPTFNQKYNIEFFNKTLIVDEGALDEIPDHN